MRSPVAPEMLARLGPLDVAESVAAARLRCHQAWYRSEVLQLSRFGRLPLPSGRPVGSVLHPEDAVRGANFTSPAARSLYQRRRAEGWGVDPQRCTTVMTSSQALTINLMAPLFNDLRWAGAVFGQILGIAGCVVDDIWLEYAPARRSLFLQDSTRMDVLVALRYGAESRYVAIEVKLVDRFISRVLPIGEAYQQLFSDIPLWRSNIHEHLDRSTNQLLRVHALAAAIGRVRGATKLAGLLLLTHPLLGDATSVARAYRQQLNDASDLTHATLAALLAVMHDTAGSIEDRQYCVALRERYIDLEPSEAVWVASQADRSSGRTVLS
ncbi:PGN_0703 family putative restriction endonuclease [Modestobacter lapidis]|nr:hypothetical protein [Modestobacter lapidis]